MEKVFTSYHLELMIKLLSQMKQNRLLKIENLRHDIHDFKAEGSPLVLYSLNLSFEILRTETSQKSPVKIIFEVLIKILY